MQVDWDVSQSLRTSSSISKRSENLQISSNLPATAGPLDDLVGQLNTFLRTHRTVQTKSGR